MKRITWMHAEKLACRRLDRRRAYYTTEDENPEPQDSWFPGAVLFDYGEWTTTCSGCFESEFGGIRIGFRDSRGERGVGCSECGYTGRRRDGFFAPVEVNGKQAKKDV